MADIAVVTGANSGIGLATALRLAGDGYEVFAGTRGEAGIEAIEQAATAAGADGVHAVQLDVTDDASVEAAFGRVLAAGPVAVLVNNAGISGAGTVERTPIAEFQANFDTNVLGTIRCIQHVLPGMRDAGGGRIVNISSATAVLSQPLLGAYGLTKHAVEGLSESLQAEVAPFGVRVIVVRPGTILTPIWGKAGLLDPDPDYAAAQDILMAVVTHNLSRSGVPPEAVAEVIAAAIADDDPAFRHDVGDIDVVHRAHANLDGGDGLYDLHALEGDDFRQRYAEVTGIDYWG